MIANADAILLIYSTEHILVKVYNGLGPSLRPGGIGDWRAAEHAPEAAGSRRLWYNSICAQQRTALQLRRDPLDGCAYRRAPRLVENGDRTRDEASQSHRPHRDQRGRLYRAFRRRSRMADVPPGTKRFLWHERLHEVDRYEAARPEDLRGEPPEGGRSSIQRVDTLSFHVIRHQRTPRQAWSSGTMQSAHS